MRIYINKTYLLLLAIFVISSVIYSCKNVNSEEKTTVSKNKADNKLNTDSSKTINTKTKQLKDENKVIIYYFFGDYRCSTCINLEKYSSQAINQGFKEEIANGKIEWKPVNYDKPENVHFKKDYNLYTKALIMSEYKDNKQIRWKNCEKIWELIHNPKKFVPYVQNEVKTFITGK